MEDVERLHKGTTDEMDRLLAARNVVGEPVTVEGTTIIPLLSIGFGFGAGGGSGSAPQGTQNAGSGTGGMSGAGGGVKPIAIVVINRQGDVKVERVEGGGAFEKLGEALGKAMERMPMGAGGRAGGGASTHATATE